MGFYVTSQYEYYKLIKYYTLASTVLLVHDIHALSRSHYVIMYSIFRNVIIRFISIRDRLNFNVMIHVNIFHIVN